MNITDFPVEVCKSFSQTIQARKFEPVAAFCSAKASCPFSQAQEMAALLYNFCRDGVKRDLAAFCEEMGLATPDSPNVIEGDTPAASDAAFQAQARKNSKAEQARVAEEVIAKLRANGAQINDVEDSSAVQAGQSSDAAVVTEGGLLPSQTGEAENPFASRARRFLEALALVDEFANVELSVGASQEAPSKISDQPAVQSGQPVATTYDTATTITATLAPIPAAKVRGKSGRKARPGTVDELEASKAQKVTATAPGTVETPANGYQATEADLPESMQGSQANEGSALSITPSGSTSTAPGVAGDKTPVSPPDQISLLRQAASDLVLATGITAQQAREIIWAFLLASTGLPRKEPTSPEYAPQAACLPGIVALIPQRDAEAVMFSTKPVEFGKLWKSSYDKLRAESSKMTESEWAKALALAAEKYPTAPGDLVEFLD